MITARAVKRRPSVVSTPPTWSPWTTSRATIPWVSSRSRNPSSSCRTARRYSVRSHCARGAHTAGPLDRLSIRNWIAARSLARPMRPPSASISRTTVPFAIPPIAGLHDILPIVSRLEVISSARAPSRAHMTAASVPAWPAPTMITSYSIDMPKKLVRQDGQKLDAQTHSGEPLTGFGWLRSRLGHLPEQPKQRLARLCRERFKPPIVRRLHIAHIPSDYQGSLDLGQGSPCGVQEPPILSRPLPAGAFCNVEWDAVARSAQLVRQSSLFVLWEPARRLDAFHRQPLRVLPCLESVVYRHGHMIARRPTGPPTISTPRVTRLRNPVYRCASVRLALAYPSRPESTSPALSGSAASPS